MNNKELHAKKIIEKLRKSGYKAYLVGGCVRDKLLNRPINDWDVTTSALPSQIKEVFKGHSFVESGIKHGTVGVIDDGDVFEITTFRADGDYLDCRRPEKVDFVKDIYEDLSRRDFTVNAIAFNDDEGYVDYYGGVEDVKNGVIRAVGDGEKRFTEDALRILRAVRFSATLGFEIEDNTFQAMLKCKFNLKSIAKERVFEETTKTLTGEYSHKALKKCKDIIFEVIPELACCDGFDQKSLSHSFDVLEHTLVALSLSKKRSPRIMWALLLHDIAKPLCFILDRKGYGHTNGHMEKSAEIAKEVLTRLKAPKKLINDVCVLVYNHDREIGDTKYGLKTFLKTYGLELAKDLLFVKKADMFAHSQHGIEKYVKFVILYENYLNEIIENDECYSLSQLKINGNDLLKLGFSGKELGAINDKLLDKVMKGEIENEAVSLLSFAKSYK